MACAAHASVGHEPANLAARHGLAPQLHFGIDLYLKTHLAPKLGQHLHITGSLVPESEVVSLVHLAGMKLLLEDALCKLPRRHQRKIAPEGQEQDGIDPGVGKQTKLLRSRSEQFQGRFRSENPRWMR